MRSASDRRAPFVLTLTVLLALLPASLPAADAPAGDKPAATEAKRPEAKPEDAPPPDPNERTAKLLQKPVKVDFKEVALHDVLDALAEQAGVDVVPEWRALEEAGVTRDRPVTLRLREAKPAEVVFQILFRAVGGGVRLDVDQGVVFVGVEGRAQEERPAVTLQTYDVADLFKDGVGTADEQAAKLIAAMTQVIEPESWKVNGGATNVAIAYAGKLYVRATEPVHAAVGQFIISVRQGRALEPEKK